MESAKASEIVWLIDALDHEFVGRAHSGELCPSLNPLWSLS